MKEQKQKEDDKKVLTDHFIGTLPPLLNKYIADADKLLNLLQLPLHFNYEVYTTTRRERDLDAYLNALSDIVQRHTTADVCRNYFFVGDGKLNFFCLIRFLMRFQNVSNVFVM